MIISEDENLIIKYLTNQISIAELEKLELWIKEGNNEEVFKSYVKVNFAIDYSTKEFSKHNTKKQLLEKINKDKKVFRMKSYYRIRRIVAAVLVIGLFIGTYFFKDTIVYNILNKNVGVINKIKTGTDKAVLTLEDGTSVALEKGTKYTKDNVKSNGEKIIYKYKEQKTKEIVYNYLTIPRGGQFFVSLSDGTKVWLNSASKLKYPVNFIEGETRIVELVYGEAYFEVSSSINHNGSKFKVLSNLQEIEVLGTEFNIKAYSDEDLIYTTLLKGSIALYNFNKKNILKPSEQAVLDTKKNSLIISTQVDAYSEVVWKRGLFSFKDKTLKEIMKVLSRWYDVDVVFEDKSLEDVKFKGVISKNQNLADILLLIKKTKYIKNYEIKENTLILKK
ncbi:FecR family protein [Polaribacter sp. L3A8]|uniref:FecR family protein n=1 Tax=Polaribacter sp. L3A8 TaxID=2686361 RepID=UPI00131CD2D0|nr:FecR family protein [Polaribacter sp. L3A8]